MKGIIFLGMMLVSQCAPQLQSIQVSTSDPAQTCKSGIGEIEYKIVRPGYGAVAEEGQIVEIYEKIQYPNGREIFSFERPDAPVSFRIGAHQVVEGLDKGVRGMLQGEIRQLTLPPSLTQRADYPSWLSPDSTLIYTVEMVLVGQEGAVYQSTDFGLTWEDISAGLPNNLQIQCIRSFEDGLLIGTGSNGIYKRENGVWVPTGAMSRFHIENFFSADSEEQITGIYPTKDGCYISVSNGGLFFSKDGGAPWIPVNIEMEEKSIQTLLQTQQALLVGADTGIYRSTDHGQAWTKVLDQAHLNSLVESNGVLIGGTFRGAFRSTDGGEHWSLTLPNTTSHKLSVIDGHFVSVTGEGKLLRSIDGGATWQDWNGNLPIDKNVYEVKQTGGFLICSHQDGLFRSGDDGVTWELVRPRGKVPFANLEFTGSVMNGVIYAIAVPGC